LEVGPQLALPSAVKLSIVIAAVLLAAGERPAAADSSPDFELGVRWSGGFGASLDATRPIFLGTFGMDAFVPLGSGHAVGVGLDVFWREYPDAWEKPERPEGTAGIYYRWRRARARGKWRPWLAAGAGYRQRQLDDRDIDPLLGVVRQHGVSVTMEGGGDVRLSKDTRLALFFDWTMGCYLSATRDASPGYVEAHDEPQPAPDSVSCLESSSSTYSGGLRWSMEFF